MVAKYATGMPKKALWYSIYGQIPSAVGGTKEREWKPFIFDKKVLANINDVMPSCTRKREPRSARRIPVRLMIQSPRKS